MLPYLLVPGDILLCVICIVSLRSSVRRHILYGVHAVYPVYLKGSRPLWRSPHD